MDPGPLRDGLTVLAGVTTGVLSGLFGVGGAVVSTPAIRLLGASAALSVGTTLPAIIPGAASGTARYGREGLIDWNLVRWAGPTGAVAAVGGALLVPVVPGDGHLLMLATAALLGFSAWRMIRSARPATPPPTALGAVETDSDLLDAEVDAEAGATTDTAADATARASTAGNGPVVVVGAVAGLLSGLLGVGGGIVMVPGFSQVAHRPLKQAIATSLACVAIFAVPGTITHAVQGDIDWRFALLLAVGVVPGARLGAALTMRADDHRLRVLVGGFLALTAVLYAAGELHSWLAA